MTSPALFPDPTALSEPIPLVMTAPIITKKVPDLTITELMRLRRDETITVHSQQYLEDNRPVALSTTYIPDEVITRVSRLTETSITDFADTVRASGYAITSVSDTTGARRFSPEERKLWRIPETMPAIQHRRIVWDNQGEALYVVITELIDNRYRFAHNFSGDNIALAYPLSP